MAMGWWEGGTLGERVAWGSVSSRAHEYCIKVRLPAAEVGGDHKISDGWVSGHGEAFAVGG